MKTRIVPLTVIDILIWKNENKKWPKSVEKHNESYTNSCGGEEMTDVLFSFLGIYAIGVWVYNKNIVGLFKREANKIKVSVEKNGIYDQILCSKKFLLQLQDEQIAGINVYDLNEDIKEFAEVYFNVGNLIPMWPGGNKLKGNQNKGFMDIPELFFSRYFDWYEDLAKKENVYLKNMSEYLIANKDHFGSLENFLDALDSVDEYRKYIKHVVSVIKERTKCINKS